MNLPVNVPYRELIVKTADQLLVRNIPIRMAITQNFPRAHNIPLEFRYQWPSSEIIRFEPFDGLLCSLVIRGVYKYLVKVYEYYSRVEEVAFQNLHYHAFLNTANSNCILSSHCLMQL